MSKKTPLVQKPTSQKTVAPTKENNMLIYLVFIILIVLVILFPFCKKYDAYKTKHKEKKWLSYF